MKKALKYINLILIAAIIAISVFLGVVAKNYYRLEQRNYDYNRMLNHCVIYTYHEMYYAVKDLFKSYDAEINISIKPKKYKSLLKNVPWSGQDYKKCTVSFGSAQFNSKIKLHGDGYWHYNYDQKSFKIKLKDNKNYDQNNVYHLVCPKGNEAIHNLVSYHLSRSIGVLTPRARITSLKINDDYQGLKLMVEDLNESFIRRNNLLPGDLYSGENLSYKDRFYGAWKTLVTADYVWSKKSYNNHYDKENNEPLKALLLGLTNESYDLIDLKEFAKFSVAIDLMNSYHFDTQHNWRLYFDPARQKFVPITWDPVGFWDNWYKRKGQEKHGIITSRIMKHLYHNYDFLRYRQQALNNFYTNQIDTFRDSVNVCIDKAKALTRLNNYNAGLHSNYLNKEEILAKLDSFNYRVSAALQQNRELFYTNDASINYSILENGIRIKFYGSNPLTKLTITTTNQLIEAEQYTIQYRLNDSLFNSEQQVATLKSGKLNIDQTLLANISTVRVYNPEVHYSAKIEYDTATYDILFEQLDPNTITSVTATLMDDKFSNIEAQPITSIKPASFYNVHKVLQAGSSEQPVVWQSEIKINKDTIIESPVLIRPGSNILISDKVSVIFKNRVEAVGTKTQPIQFTSLDTTVYGCIALLGSFSNDSKFHFCNFSNGSGQKTNLVEYSGMVSVHDVQNVEFKNCDFSDSKIYDDMLHIVYSSANLENCRFTNSHADAFDADISEVRLSNCLFKNSGNDGLDLMTSSAEITQCTFTNNGDKGISVGERSRAQIMSSNFTGNAIGVANKDESQTTVNNCSFIENDVALIRFRKNWRYRNSGEFVLINSVLSENKKDSVYTNEFKD